MPDAGRPPRSSRSSSRDSSRPLAIVNDRRDAARFASIDPTALFRWVHKGKEEPRDPCADLRASVLDAEAKVMALGCIA